MNKTRALSSGLSSAHSLREHADALRNEAIWHFHDFKQFRVLYYRSAEQLECLNAVAPGFFSDLHRWLLDRIVLNVTKMLDPAETNGKENLTIPALHDMCVAESTYPTGEADALIAALRLHAKRVAPWRHHLVAHIDRAAALAHTNTTYEFVASEIHSFYHGLEQYFGLVYRSLWGTVLPIDGHSISDARELIRAVRDGAIMDELRERDILEYDRLHRESRFGRVR